MSDIYDVSLSRKAVKQLRKVPKHIALKLEAWVDAVAYEGLSEVRKTPGYHDEPLFGKRNGQSSIRLSRAYRAIDNDGVARFIEIIEVNKHEY